ncbi:MAG: STAS domain-containing protein [Phycisphaerales bacterium]
MWNPFAKDAAADGEAPLVPPAPGVLPPTHGAADLRIPVDGTADASVEVPVPAAVGGADAPVEASPRSRIADVQLVEGIAVATITVTELSHDSGAHQLADLLMELSETTATDFVLDLQSVQFMDSACLGCLVEALNRLAVGGGQIALANGNHSVQYLFRLTRLDRVFAVCSDVMTAIDTLKKRRAA